MAQPFNWKERFADHITTAPEAVKQIQSGNSVFIGTGCAQPQHLVRALAEHSKHIYDAHIIHLLTVGDAPYADEQYRDRFKMNSFFVADNVRHALESGFGDYTPIFLSEIPGEFESGRLPVDVALISVSPPNASGLCSFGVSVDIVKAAAANAKIVIAQVNRRIPQALAEFLRDKKELGVHTEMFSDWIIDLIDCGAITCTKKTINRGKVVASFCMGSQRLYDYIDDNSFFEFRPTEYVNDPFVIAQHDKMVGINVGLEVDLTGQVCADSLGYRFYSGIGGQVDFIRGSSRSRGGKAIIALPSTAKNDTISRIVPHLTEGAGVVTTRGDVHYVVTEYGTAYLHGRSIRDRVMSLINIAHPKFRNGLIEAAKKQQYVPADQIELPWEQVRYPEELERYEVLKDGTQIFFRPVKPTDEQAMTEMLYSLSRETVRTR